MSGRPKEGNEAQLEYSNYFFLHAYMYRTYIYIVPTYLSKKECQQTKDDKISATCKVCDFIKLACTCHQEERELHGNCDNGTYCQIVGVSLKNKRRSASLNVVVGSEK